MPVRLLSSIRPRVLPRVHTVVRPRVHTGAGRSAGAMAAGLVAGALFLCACSSSSPAAHHSAGGTTTTTAGLSAQTPTTTTTTNAPGTGTGPTASSTTSTTNPPETAAPGAPITVASPSTGSTVGSPLTVSGTSKLGAQAIQVQLTDGSGNLLCQAVAHPGSAGAFTVTMRFAVAQPGPGSLALFMASSGNARQDLTQVPLQLSD